MKIDEYITALRKEKNIVVSFQKGDLKVSAEAAALTQEILDDLKKRKPEILTFFKSAILVGNSPIMPADVKAFYKLSSAQKRLHFLHLLDTTSLAYNLPCAIRISGALDKNKVETIFEKLVERHESLRTSFQAGNEEVVQKVAELAPFEVRYFHAAEREVPLVIEQFIKPFSLEHGNLMRVAIIEIESNAHVLLLDMHHIISDGVSQSILIKEFTTLYNGGVLPPLALHYKDFAEWQHAPQMEDSIKRQRDFWVNEFAGELNPLELQTDFPRPSVKTFDGDVEHFVFEPDVTSKLIALAEQQGATLFMLMLAFYNVLLSKLSGLEDVVIGTPVAGRQHTEWENSIGLFANTLPLRNLPKGDYTFTEFLSDLKTRTLNCLDNQLLSYEELVSQLNIKRDTSRNPLFDVMFAFQNFDSNELRLPGMTLTPMPIRQFSSKFDITLVGYEHQGRLLLKFEYCSKLFRADTIRQFAGYIRTIAWAVINNNSIKLRDIDILTDQEREQIINQFNDTQAEYPAHATIVSLFREQVEKCPHKTALVYQEQNLSYRELDDLSDRMASFFVAERGVRVGDRICVALQRDIHLLPVIYAILKSGGVYVPIDPTFPIDRINSVLLDSTPSVFVTRKRYFDDQVSSSVCVDDLDDILAWCNTGKHEISQVIIKGNDLAYIIYTSGSTGKPKGVMIEHHSVVNRILWMQKEYAITVGDTLIQKTPLIFDVSVWELFWWSFTGATLCLLPPGGEKEPRQIINAVKTNKVTTIHFVPSMLSSFLSFILENGDYEALSTLRLVFTSGEALKPEHVKSFAQTIHANCGSRLINLYGPTEATVDVSYFECTFDKAVSVIPIGKPIDNTGLYVLDKWNALTGIGVPGELCIAGVGLSRGYINNRQLTDAKFVSYPNRHGNKIYRTGDLAKWLPDGNIEYLGRIDNQIKLRGYRIELGEIESLLSTCEGVTEAAVLVKGSDENKSLVAYYVAATPIHTNYFQAFLNSTLPAYMVPSHYVHMAAFPLTPSGKLDRKALPDPDITFSEGYLAPRTTEERLLTEAWSKVLGITNIGIADNFFSVGGDSIKSIQICSRLRGAGYDLSVQDIFHHQSIRELATRLKPLTAIPDQALIEGTGALTPIQHWFFNSPITDKHHFNQSVLLKFETQVSREDVSAIFHQLQTHHDALRIVFPVSDEKIFPHNLGLQLPLSLHEQDLSHSSTVLSEITCMANEIQSGIDLSSGPLMRLGLFHSKDGSFLLIVIHHLVVDTLSWRILLEDIETLYQQLKTHQKFSLPLKTDAFLTWSTHLLNYISGRTYAGARAYGDKSTRTSFISLPKDFAADSFDLKDTRRDSFVLSKEHTRKLLREVHKCFNTQINDILLTGLLMAVHKQFGRDSLLLDLESHGREPVQPGMNVSRTVGWFTTIYPVFLEAKCDDAGSAIRLVKETLRQIPGNGIDYLVSQYLDPESKTACVKATVCFNYLGQFDSDISGQSFTVVSNFQTHNKSQNGISIYDWDISGMIREGQLEMTIAFGESQYREGTIRALMSGFRESLETIIDYCSHSSKTILTPSDLTYKSLTLSQLDRLQEQYSAYGIEDIYPLSPMQEGMLFHSELESNSGSYFGQTTCELVGKLDVRVVEESLNELMNRHDILRTVFVHADYERPLQVVLKERKISLCFADASGCLPEEKQSLIATHQQEERSQPFDLGADVLMRVRILQISEREYVLIWSHHHVLMDGWCMGIIVNEFRQIYSGKINRKPVSLPATVPYSRYITWLEQRPKETSGSYWMDYLQGYESLSGLPKKSAGLKEAGYSLESYEISINKETTGQLTQVSRKYGVSLNTIFQFAWGLLLSRYNNTGEVVFGSVVSGRPAEVEGIESMVGLFINTVPVRITYAGSESSVAQTLREIQRSAIEGAEHHYHPLSEIQSLSTLGRELLDHIIIFENFPLSNQIDPAISEIEIKKPTYRVQTNYELNVSVVPGDALGVRLTYNTNRYETQIIKEVAVYLNNILKTVAHNPELLIRDVSLYDEAQKRSLEQMLTQKLEVAGVGTIQEKLKKSFKAHSHRVAVEYDQREFTYAAIEAQANNVASLMNRRAVPEGAYVGVLCDDRSWVISAFIGLLKSRTAFVPLEPGLPKERLATMVNQIGCRYIVTDQTPEDYQQLSNAGAGITWITTAEIKREGAPDYNEEKAYEGDDIIYVYFTSGTTGVPKAVAGKNKGLSHFIGWEIETFAIDSSFRFSQFTNPGFDVFLRDIFVPLCAGATICVPHHNVLGAGQGPGDWIVRKKINLIHCVPSVFKLFGGSSPQQHRFCELKYILLAGEKVSPHELREWFASHNVSVQLVNIYGPTETTLAKGYYKIQESDSRRRYIPIQPISGAQFLILDKDLHACPRKGVGEIYIRTPYRTAGYLNSTSLPTPFIPNPWSNSEEETLYKTGDLGRAHDDGKIEILGRSDHQVKIRGIRIELEDIKANILRYPGIQTAVVVVKEDTTSEKMICAYIVSPHEISVADLRRYVSDRLPSAMVPSFFVQLPKMPLSHNGKIDRKALPDPEWKLDSMYMPPESSGEGRLVEIWSEILKIDKRHIGTATSFFELGGHSIKAFYLTYKIRQTFSVDINLREVFHHPTIKEQLLLIGQNERSDNADIPKAEKREYYPASPAQERLYYKYLVNRESMDFNITIPLAINGDVDVDRLQESFQKLTERHAALRTSFTLSPDGIRQVVNENVKFSLESLQGTKYRNTQEAFLAFRRPFDLASESLMRCGLLQDHQDSLLFIDIHHIIADATSLGILTQDFKKIYFGETLKPIALNYVDYADWLNHEQDKLNNQRAFWLNMLSGELPRVNIRTNTERALDWSQVRSKELIIEGEQYRRIKAVVAKNQVSDFMMFLGAYYILLFKASESNDIIIGTEALGRTQHGLEEVVGTFVNVLPLRMQILPDEDFGSFLSKVKQVVLNGFSNQDFQFNQIASLVESDAGWSRNPVFDFYFSYASASDTEHELRALKFVPATLERPLKSEYEFYIKIIEGKGKYRISFIYSSELYDNATIELMISYYSNILRSVAEGDNIQIDEIEVEDHAGHVLPGALATI